MDEYDRAAAIAARKEAANSGRRKKKKTASSTSLASNTFQELYRLTGEVLGQGAYAIVQTCVNIYTEAQPGQGLQGDQPLPPRPGPQ